MVKMVNVGRAKNDEAGVPLDCWASVDPGDVHVGVCYWKGTEPQWAREFRPDEFVDWLIEKMYDGEIKLLVFEVFMLYGHKAFNQVGSTFGTAELIGVMRHLCRRAEVPFVGYQASAHKTLYKWEKFKPPQKPLRSWVSYGHGCHTKDAECAGYFHLVKNGIIKNGS